MTRNAISTICAATVALTSLLVSPSAHADGGRVTLDWERTLVDLDAYARGNDNPLALPRDPDRKSERQMLSTPTVSLQPFEQTAGNAWFGVAPRVSFVARDWASAFRIAGDRLSLVDAARITSSTRMILTRVRVSETRITPFTQIGLGQWRTDPYLLPLMPRNHELAGQFGGGFEIHVTPGWEIACEGTLTAIYREQREPQNLAATRLWSVMLASHVTF